MAEGTRRKQVSDLIPKSLEDAMEEILDKDSAEKLGGK
jgi:hypothetical protein